MTSASNSFVDVVSGLTIDDSKVTAAGESVTINTSKDITGIKDKVSAFIDAYNDALEWIEQQIDTKKGSTV